jgi:hypothetical protein
MKLNESTSVHIDLTNNKSRQQPIFINGTQIPYANTAKYLGMTLYAKLRRKEHIKKKSEDSNCFSSLIVFTPKMEAICYSETSVLTRTTRRHIPNDDILQSHRLEHLKSYIAQHQGQKNVLVAWAQF